MNIRRIVKHLLTTDGHVRRVFPRSALIAVEQAIRDSEVAHDGEVRVAIEGALDGAALFRGQSARERAIELFSLLRVWDTAHNNGLLIYLLLADRAVEIVADRAIDAKVGSEAWCEVCRQMETAFKQSDYEGGVTHGVHSLTRHLAQHFPASGKSANELPDMPVMV